MEKKLTKKEIKFLKESNAIEREYSKEALEDSCDAWHFALRHQHMINIDFITAVHLELLKRLNPKIAGQIRGCPVYVGNQTHFRECLKSEFIEDALIRLCKLHPLKTAEAIKQWHIDFENIHPFVDGNGRVGRIIMNVQRLQAGLPIFVIHAGEEQFEYYKWFKELK